VVQARRLLFELSGKQQEGDQTPVEYGSNLQCIVRLKGGPCGFHAGAKH
jgi:hypothetical protein